MRTQSRPLRGTSQIALCVGVLLQTALLSLAPSSLGAAEPGSDSARDATVRALGAPRLFDAVYDELRSVPRFKEEFETTAAYEQRRDKALQVLAPQYLIWAPVDLKYVRYNADTQTLLVETYALSNTGISRHELSAIFGFGSVLEKGGIHIEYSPLANDGNIAWALPERTEDVGTYTGQNAFGAMVTVAKQAQLSRGVFEREGSHDENIWSAKQPAYDKDAAPIAFAIKVAAPEAQLLKKPGQLRAAFLVAPSHPYHASGTSRSAPTVNSLVDRTTNVKYIIGDIQCAALFDGNGRLLATRSTQ